MEFIVNIDIDDLDRGIEFYEKGLGLKLQRRLFEGTVAEMEAGQSKVYLVENKSGSTAIPDKQVYRDYSRHWTPVHLDFPVSDIRESVKQALSAGAKQEIEIQTFYWGYLATMSDPFGHGFCLLQFKNGGYEKAE